VTLLIAMLVQGLHLILMLATAPLAVGLSHRVAARLAGRAGPGLIQPWRDLWRLFRKQAVFAETASGLFEVAPAVAFAALAVAAALVPSFALGMAAAPLSDLIVVAGLLMLARTTVALAAMESGTALGGLGASRSMALAGFTEPALLMAIFTLGLLTGTTNLDAMTTVLRDGTMGLKVPLVLAVAALMVVAIARLRTPSAATVPFAETAMTEDALTIEYSGRPLALLRWGDALRRLLWLSLLADIVVPFGLSDATGSPLWWGVGIVLWAIKMAMLTVALGVWQAMRAARPVQLATVLGAGVLLALLAAVFLIAGQGLT
jgi:formate hydrogenlyase subunit 4